MDLARGTVGTGVYRSRAMPGVILRTISILAVKGERGGTRVFYAVTRRKLEFVLAETQ